MVVLEGKLLGTDLDERDLQGRDGGAAAGTFQHSIGCVYGRNGLYAFGVVGQVESRPDPDLQNIPSDIPEG